MFIFLGSSLASGLAWPPGWPGLRLKWAKGRFGSKNYEKVKVLRMEFSIVENLSGPQESILNPSRRPQLHFGEKNNIICNAFTLFLPKWSWGLLDRLKILS